MPVPYWGDAEIVEPDAEALSRFTQTIKGLGKWKRKYEIDVLDGHDWKFLIEGPGVNFKASGCSAYPDNFDDAIKAIVEVSLGHACPTAAHQQQMLAMLLPTLSHITI